MHYPRATTLPARLGEPVNCFLAHRRGASRYLLEHTAYGMIEDQVLLVIDMIKRISFSVQKGIY